MEKRIIAFLIGFLILGSYSNYISAQQDIIAPPVKNKPKPQPKKRHAPTRSKPNANATGVFKMVSKKVVLNDNDVWFPTSYFDTIYTKKKELEIAEKYAKKMINSPILRALGVSDHADAIVGTFKSHCEGLYGSLEYHSTFTWNGGLNKFLHEAIKHAKVREWGVSLLGDMFVEFCKYYPKDFREKTIGDLQRILARVEDMDVREYKVVGNFADLYINGKQADFKTTHSLEGFVVRRILLDNVSKSEIKTHLRTLISRIEKVDTSKNAVMMAQFTINNDITFCITARENYYLFRKTNKKFIPYKESDKYGYVWKRRAGSTRLKYTTDGTTRYYDIETGYKTSAEWKKYTDERMWRVFVNNKGEVIIQE